jgi:hypothetical protein
MSGRAKAFADALNGKYPSPKQAKELYRLRDLDVQDLQRKATITVADVRTLTMHGRFRIANESFDKCDAEAQDALRKDPHHGVRAAVATFRPPTPFNYLAAPAA